MRLYEETRAESEPQAEGTIEEGSQAGAGALWRVLGCLWSPGSTQALLTQSQHKHCLCGWPGGARGRAVVTVRLCPSQEDSILSFAYGGLQPSLPL